MKLFTSIEKGTKGSEILQQDNLFIVFNFTNFKERTTSLSYPSKDYKTIGGAVKYSNKFLNA